MQSVQQTVDALLHTLTALDGQPHGAVATLNWEDRVVNEVWSFTPATSASAVSGGETQRAEPQPPVLVAGDSLDTEDPWGQAARSGVASFGLPETVLPLPGRQQAPGIGVLVFGPSYTPGDEDEQAFLLSVAGLGGQALDRAVAQDALTERTQQLEERNLELHGFTRALAENLGDPLERIHGFLRLAEADLGEHIPVRARRMFTFARLEAEMLAERTDELRTLARVDQQSLRMETVNLSRLLGQVRHDLEPLTRGRAVAWEIGELSDVRGDALLLYQAFLELLAFALENTWDHAEPHIGISAQMPDGYVVVTIWNNGDGVSEDAQDRLFEVLDRSVIRRTALGRLGMSNVRRVIARHGGWVRASSLPEGGLAFVLTLPRPAEEHTTSLR